MANGDFRIGAWLVQPQLNRVANVGRVAHLRPRTMDVLVHLAKRGGAVVGRGELFEAVWRGQRVEEEGLTHCIAELRAALADSPQSPSLIETIPKRGYRLMVAPQWVSAAPPCRAQAARGVLVTPFTETEAAGGGEPLSAGLCEELVAALTRNRGLRVVSANRVNRAAAGEADVDQLARRLDVCSVLEGSIRRSGTRVAIKARLVDVADSVEVWSDSFGSDVGDVLDTEERAARALAASLVASVWPDLWAETPARDAGQPASRPPDVPDAASTARVVEVRRADAQPPTTGWAVVCDEAAGLTILGLYASHHEAEAALRSLTAAQAALP
jgi:DNA-binding winged helix-turn-helix (wHTH) protein